MALPLLPIIAIAALAMFAGGTKKKRKPAGPKPTQWLSPGDLCDPLNPSDVPPGYGCFEGGDGNFYVMEEYDPAKAPPLEYGEFGDEQGISEALMLLGFDAPGLPTNIARFQEYAYTYFDLDEGSLRFDGRLDNKTISYLSKALADFENGKWVPEEQYLTEEALADFEYENAATVVSAWQQDPLIAWEFPDGETVQPLPGGQSLSSWLTSAVYWGTYNVGGPDEPGASMPKTFWPVPYTDRWNAETEARNIWLRIEQYVKLQMDEQGVADVTIYPEDQNA